MTEGERQMQQLSLDGGMVYDSGRCSNTEMAGSSSGGAGGDATPTSPVSPAAAGTSSDFAGHGSGGGESSSNGVPLDLEESNRTAGKKDDTLQSTSSETSTDTFYTPSASLHNISGSKMMSKGRRPSSLEEDYSPKEKPVGRQRSLEEVSSESGISSLIPATVSEDVESFPEETVSTKTGRDDETHKSQQLIDRESRQPNMSSKESKNLEQHKRQNSGGSQCSLSSNPENSQFKTADAHSSDSDGSRNSGNTSGIFDNCSSTLGGLRAGGSGGEYGKDDMDRMSLQSDHSHSGEQLNTSVESVEFGGSGELVVRRLPPEVSGHGIQGAGLGNISPGQGPILVSSGSKPRGKKKMWYQQIFSTSYKTRSGDFKKIFKDLPPKERLIVDYSCALQKEILLQGRMYVSQNYVSFYANIFGWETQISISFKEIESITKEKTALIIPNAIGILTLSEKFFFSSFVTRDTTYVMLFKLWQSALLDDNITKKELWRLVHTCYGEELGVTSEDESEEVYCPPLVVTSAVSTLITSTQVDAGKSIAIDSEPTAVSSSPGKASPGISIFPCDDEAVEEDGDDEGLCDEPRIGSWSWCRLRGASPIHGMAGEIGSAIAVGLNIGSSIVTSNGIPIGAEQLLIKDSQIVPLPVPLLPPVAVEQSDSSDTDAIPDADLHPDLPHVVPGGSEAFDSGGENGAPVVPPVCPVDHSIGKEMLNAVIPCDIDQLFTMLFTSSKFYLDFQLSRKTFDMNQCEWQLKDGSHKTRQLTFTVLTGQSLGPKTAQVTETQTLLPASRPGLLYAIQSESVNAGIPYADAFAVNCHYCLTKISPSESNITVISKIHYKKSVWAKSFIEKNSMSALTDYFNHLERALKEDCAKTIAGSITPTSPLVISNLPRRRHPRKKCRAPDIPASAMVRPVMESASIHSTLTRTLRSPASLVMPDSLGDSSVADAVEGSLVMKVILTVLGCLLLLNAFLYFKLNSLEEAANSSVVFPPAVKFTGETPQTHQEWLLVLQQQETLHRSEIHGWHEILVSAIKILHQAETDLENLKSHISTYGTGDVKLKLVSRETADLLYASSLKMTHRSSPPQVDSSSKDPVPSSPPEITSSDTVKEKTVENNVRESTSPPIEVK